LAENVAMTYDEQDEVRDFKGRDFEMTCINIGVTFKLGRLYITLQPSQRIF